MKPIRLIRTSRHGLTRCPSCARHVHVDELRTCAFCGAALAEHGATSRLLLGARGGLIAAALLGAPFNVACEDEGSDVPDVIHQDVYGAPPNDGQPSETEVSPDVPDIISQDVYGAPPDTSEPEIEVSPDVPDIVPGDVYGAPAEGDE